VAGALLTQNTSWGNVEKAIANLRAAGKLSPEPLLKTQDPELEKLIRPSGFYRQKAARLRALTEAFVSFAGRGTPPSREELLSIKGVGKETADSILLYAYGLPYFVVDAYTRRFCAHHGMHVASGKPGREAGYDDYRAFFERSLPRSVPLYREYHALIVAWGKSRGRATPGPAIAEATAPVRRRNRGI
jgi:endonuclease-3 related protein